MAEIELKTINEMVVASAEKCVKDADDAYINEIKKLEETLENGKRQIILLAGPSGSGKTTTANILKDKLAAKGHETSVISMDNFYRTLKDPLYPRDENGVLDYEAVESLQCDLIHDCLDALLDGKTYRIPRYLFREGVSMPEALPVSMPKDGYIIMEGIHSLNPVFTSGLPLDRIMKLFVSVSTNVNDDGRRLLSGRKIRFIRRMTRDSIYRATDAAGTLERWQSVHDGEDKYLYPFKDRADYMINTFHAFELGAMKPYAMKAIEAAGGKFCGEFAEIIKSALVKTKEVPISAVPENSLIREFIPGGVYENLY